MKPTTYPYLNRREAGAAGFRALTIGYRLPQEQQILDNVLADMRRGNIPHALVKTYDGVAVWRAGGACTHSGFAAAISGACTQSFQTGVKTSISQSGFELRDVANLH